MLGAYLSLVGLLSAAICGTSLAAEVPPGCKEIHTELGTNLYGENHIAPEKGKYIKSVKLEHRKSYEPCWEEFSYGYKNNDLWVKRACRGIFVLIECPEPTMAERFLLSLLRRGHTAVSTDTLMRNVNARSQAKPLKLPKGLPYPTDMQARPDPKLPTELMQVMSVNLPKVPPVGLVQAGTGDIPPSNHHDMFSVGNSMKQGIPHAPIHVKIIPPRENKGSSKITSVVIGPANRDVTLASTTNPHVIMSQKGAKTKVIAVPKVIPRLTIAKSEPEILFSLVDRLQNAAPTIQRGLGIDRAMANRILQLAKMILQSTNVRQAAGLKLAMSQPPAFPSLFSPPVPQQPFRLPDPPAVIPQPIRLPDPPAVIPQPIRLPEPPAVFSHQPREHVVEPIVQHTVSDDGTARLHDMFAFHDFHQMHPFMNEDMMDMF